MASVRVRFSGLQQEQDFQESNLFKVEYVGKNRVSAEKIAPAWL
jgi:hypothetical protein